MDGLYYLAARKLGVKENALALLYTLNDGKTRSQKQLAQELFIPKTTINTIVRENVDLGYIRLENAGHRKEKRILLTERGKAYADRILRQVYAAEESAMARTLEEFSPKLLDGLEAFTGYLREAFHREILDDMEKEETAQ